jgi:hypothetical protein
VAAQSVKRDFTLGALGALCGALLAWAALPAAAEERNEFWPALDAYFTLGQSTRLYLAATGTWAEKTQTSTGTMRYEDAYLGAHLDVTLAPLLRPELAKGDWHRARYLWTRIGYSYSRSLGDAEASDPFRERRGILELSGRTPPLAAGLELVSRIKWDARDVSGRHSNRYRLRLGVEKSLLLAGRAVVPFANAETFYDTRYDTWNRQLYQAGAEIELDRSWRLEPSLYRQNDSRSEPSRVNVFGLALKYFH